MDLTSLRAFVAVAEKKSVTKAADVMCCVPSAITARIRQLEDELEHPLFYRKPGGMVLTPSGVILLKYAEQAVRLFEEARKAVRDEGEPSGELAVGATATATTVYLPSMFARYHRQYPKVELKVVSNVTDRLIEKVLGYSLDFAIINRSVNNPDIEKYHLRREELILVTALDVESIHEMDTCTLFVAETGCVQRSKLIQWFEKSGLAKFSIMECHSTEMRLSCVAAGMGITMIPLSTLCKMNYQDSVRIHPAPESLKFLDIYLIRNKNAVQTKSRLGFIDIVLEESRNLTPVRRLWRHVG